MIYEVKKALRLYRSWRKNECFIPYTVELLVSSLCNLRCVMCNAWKLARKNPSVANEELSISEYENLLDELSFLGTKFLCISGGEPLLKKDIFSIIQTAKEKNFGIELITNGTMVSDAIAMKLVESDLDVITFSIDAPRADLHDQIRGVKGSWEKATKGLMKVNNFRKQAGSRKLRLAIDLLVTRMNYYMIPEMIDLKPTLGFDEIHFLPIIGKTPSANELFLTEKDLKWLKENFRTIKVKMELQNLPTSRLTSLLSIFNDMENAVRGRYFFCKIKLPENIKQEILCFAPWMQATVDPFGNVYPCCFACTFQNLSEDLTHSFWGKEDFSMGNLKEKSFYDIWYGERFRIFREKCADSRNFPMCHHCGSDFSECVFLTGLLKNRIILLKYAPKLMRRSA